MKKPVLLVLLSFFMYSIAYIACSPINKSIEKKHSTVKLLSYNVRNCRGMDDITDYKRIANIINRVSPDIVALQELDSATQRSNGIVALNELSSRTNMYKTYGATIAYQGGKYGIGILTKVKPIKWKVIALPGREERRGLLIVELKDFTICCTHLSLNADDRAASVDIINEALKGISKPIFLAGDFNSVPRSEVVKNFENKWSMLNNPELPTIPSNNPQRCIDYIFAAKFTGNTFQTKQTIVEHEPLASDHLPVWVEVEFK
jgi:endonuclease/exonuclease/phosphatase family metal-dependent hydrolase